MSFQYNTIEEALADLKAGKIILVSDDEDRENEGDMICAAEFATQENVNMMASHAKGLICMPMSQSLALKLGVYPMVAIYGLNRPYFHHNGNFSKRAFNHGAKVHRPGFRGN